MAERPSACCPFPRTRGKGPICRAPGGPLLLALAAALLAACAGAPVEQDRAPDEPAVDPWSVPEPVPRPEPRSRYGNPASYEVFGQRYHVLPTAKGYRERGDASWYGQKFHGRRTSSGEPYDMYALTAAHKTLPLPSWVRVTNLDNGKSLVLRVNDRGPFHPGRIIDLSYSAAVRLGVYASGHAPVEVVALDPGAAPARRAALPPDDELEALIQSLDGRANRDPEAGQAFLQLGAFRNMANCRQLQQRLELAGVPNLIAHQDAADPASPCRLLQGPYESRDIARQQAQLLEEFGYTPIIVDE